MCINGGCSQKNTIHKDLGDVVQSTQIYALFTSIYKYLRKKIEALVSSLEHGLVKAAPVQESTL